MLILVYLLLIILSIFFSRSKKLFYSIAVFLWFISAFCTDHADYQVYYLRYNNYQTLSSLTEVGFNLIIKAFHTFSFDFQAFLCIAYSFIIGVICWFIKRYTPHCAFALALYSIFPFCIDVVQLRNSIAFCICLVGISCLMDTLGAASKRAIVIYIITVIAAALVHFSSIIFLVALIPYLFDLKITAIITLIVTIVLYLFGNTRLITEIGSLFVSAQKVESVLARISQFTSQNIHAIQLAMILTTGILIAAFFVVRMNNDFEIKYGVFPELAYIAKKEINFVIGIQIVVLITLPLVQFILDIYRISRYSVILGIVGVTLYSVENSSRRVMNNIVYKFMLVGFMCLMFYLQIYRLNNFDRTFLAIFLNNKFF